MSKCTMITIDDDADVGEGDDDGIATAMTVMTVSTAVEAAQAKLTLVDEALLELTNAVQVFMVLYHLRPHPLCYYT